MVPASSNRSSTSLKYQTMLGLTKILQRKDRSHFGDIRRVGETSLQYISIRNSLNPANISLPSGGVSGMKCPMHLATIRTLLRDYYAQIFF